jgi:uncharacterized protein YuzE
MPRSLERALPLLVADIESALAHLGRGDLLKQVKEAAFSRWRHDDFADTVYLVFEEGECAERLSLYDEAGVNLDLDERGRLRGIEVLDAGRVIGALTEEGT